MKLVVTYNEKKHSGSACYLTYYVMVAVRCASVCVYMCVCDGQQMIAIRASSGSVADVSLLKLVIH